MTRLLLVEDDPIIAKGMRIMLQREGYEATLAFTAEAARSALAQGEFEIILLDIYLPDGSSLDLLAEIRARNARVPILFITAPVDEAAAKQALEAGANACLEKPFGTTTLVNRLKGLLISS